MNKQVKGRKRMKKVMAVALMAAIMITVSAAATVQAASVSAAELLCLLPKAEVTLRW